MLHNTLWFTLILIALFLGGCAFNSYYHVSGGGDDFKRLYALIPCFLWLVARFTPLNKANR
jgi:hypothetical protein